MKYLPNYNYQKANYLREGPGRAFIASPVIEKTQTLQVLQEQKLTTKKFYCGSTNKIT